MSQAKIFDILAQFLVIISIFKAIFWKKGPLLIFKVH